MTVLLFAIISLTILVAAFVQGAVGFGLGLVAAPIVAALAPELFPEAVILLAFGVTVLGSIVDRAGIDFRGTGWALLGRVPGTVLGALLVLALPARGLTILVAATVLVGIGSSLIGWRPSSRPLTLAVAGAISGVTGTATGIGGPPMALVWQRSAAKVYRGTMSSFFLVGTVISLFALSVTGTIRKDSLSEALWFMPAMVVGYALSRLVATKLDGEKLRAAAMTASVLGCLCALILPAL